VAKIGKRPGEEQLLEGGGGGGGFGSLMGKIKDKAEVFMRPKVSNRVVPSLFDRGGEYAVRNVRGSAEIEAIKNSGYMLPKEGGRQTQKHFTQTNIMPTGNAVGENSVLRVPIEKVPKNRAVSRKDVERYNSDKGEFEPLKKGGLTASSRADGCAVKGKTKGRMV
jgi:hypothetical protein